MPKDRNERVQEIFANALERSEGAEREAYLAEVCGAHGELRAQLEALLRGHKQSMGFMKTLEVEVPEAGEAPGTVIGRYKLLQLIGEGGFGLVYMAEQVEPVRRKVALKIIKLGMDTREVVARFEAERQALALMDHPNIAQVHDGGATPTGRPYFVMELVKGMPLTDYCDQEKLPTAERLDLFIQVCHAIQHAHQKGVIHRDLKPSNILVTLHDGKPVPKVIDFGIAKAIGQPLTDKTLFTRFEQLIGTPAYMSPEQAALSGLDVDTRTDIYSLGVLLYELLTGTTPVERETLRQAAVEEIRRLIRETEPPKPSTRLHTLGAKLTAVAQHRHTDPSALRKLVRGDLDWIVMQALEKDRQRRYESAGAFAVDIEHHLRHEPVTACPPSRVYRAGKFVRRHRVGVGMGAVVSFALTVGLVLALVGFARASREQRRAEREAAIAKAVNEFVRKDLLARADPENEPDRDLKLRTVLDRAAANIESRFANQPLVEAAIRLTLGQTYLGLGEVKAAGPHLRRAVELRTGVLGAEHPDTLEAMEYLGMLRLDLGQSEDAVRLLQRVCELEERALGPEHTNTLSALFHLGQVYLDQERWVEAEEVFVRLVEVFGRLRGTNGYETLVSMHELARVYHGIGQHEKSVEMNLRVFEATRKALGVRHPNTTVSMFQLALDYNALGRFAEALRLLEELVEIENQLLGPYHRSTLNTKFWLANLYGQWCRWERCAAVCREALTSTNALLDTRGPQFCYLGGLASLLAGDDAAWRYFASRYFDLFTVTTDIDHACAVMHFECLAPGTTPTNWTWQHQLVALVRTNASSAARDAGNNLDLGMIEYRCGRWDEALKCLERVPRSGDYYSAVEAGYFIAMIRHRRGEPDAAQAALGQANRRFDTFVRSGAFFGEWPGYGRAALARAGAERLILGKQRYEVLTPSTLEAARQAWAPVREQLVEGQRFAVQGNWAKARDAYLQAMAEPIFEWEAAQVAERTALGPKVGAAFLRAKDWKNRRELCQRIAAYLETLSDPGLAREYAPIFLIATNGLPPELVRKAIEWTPQDAAELEGVNKAAGTSGDLTAGMAAYRAGEYEQALQALIAEPRRQGVGNGGTTLAFRAMSLYQLGRQREAGEVLQQAENVLAKPLKNLTGDRWYNLAFAQTALEEAQALIRQNELPHGASK